MKAKVLKDFRDKQSKEIRKQGDIIEISKERFEEINSTSLFVEEVKEEKKKKTTKK